MIFTCLIWLRILGPLGDQLPYATAINHNKEYRQPEVDIREYQPLSGVAEEQVNDEQAQQHKPNSRSQHPGRYQDNRKR
jgi:hypothetical protein